MVPNNDESDESKDIENWQQLDNSLEIMCIEYMKNGDMFRFMTRIGSVGTPVPNKVLWKIFICRKCVTHIQDGIPHNFLRLNKVTHSNHSHQSLYRNGTPT